MLTYLYLTYMLGLTYGLAVQPIPQTLQASHVEVRDTSGGCGAMYHVVVVSPEFEGKPLIAQHKYVDECAQWTCSHPSSPFTITTTSSSPCPGW